MKRRIATFESFRYNENENSWNEQEVCSVCKCPCDECDCNECDCSSDWKEQEDMKLEYFGFDIEGAESLVAAVNSQDEKKVQSLIESGVNIGHRRYLPLRKAIKNENVKIVETMMRHLDANEVEEDDKEEILMEVSRIRNQRIKELVNNYFESSINERKKNKGTSYKKSGLKHPEKADLNKDKKISGWEKARGKAVQKSVQDEKEEKGTKGLSAKQKKLPAGLRKAIEARMKKSKK